VARILVLESDKSKRPHLVYQLKQVGLAATFTRNVEEISDWLCAEKMHIAEFDLLLLSSFPEQAAERNLLEKLGSIPIVVVEKEQKDNCLLDRDNVTICRPEHLLNVLKRCLHAEQLDLEQEPKRLVQG